MEVLVGWTAKAVTQKSSRASWTPPPCSIWVEKDDRRVNAKSLLGVLSLGIAKETKITLIADGPDEENAVNELAALIATGFAE